MFYGTYYSKGRPSKFPSLILSESVLKETGTPLLAIILDPPMRL